MDSSSPFYKQVGLLVQLLPFVGQKRCFALKGGTAINLFVRDLSRLSVDIDLTYLPMAERNQALRNGHEITSLFGIPASARIRPFFNHKSSK